jgi:DNA-binding transcriptional MerR regulator
VESEPRYGIEELAVLGGVNRRTVRYYVQEQLLLPPLGVGRGKHYRSEHLHRLLRVKALQEQGLSLENIRRALRQGGRLAAEAEEVARGVARVPRSAWTRLELLPGIELQVSGRYRLPSPGRLEELTEWCRQHLRPGAADDEE